MTPVEAAAHGYHALRRAAELERDRGNVTLHMRLTPKGLCVVGETASGGASSVISWAELEVPGSPALARAVTHVVDPTAWPPPPEAPSEPISEQSLVVRSKSVLPPEDVERRRGGWPKGKPRGKRAS